LALANASSFLVNKIDESLQQIGFTFSNFNRLNLNHATNETTNETRCLILCFGA